MTPNPTIRAIEADRAAAYQVLRHYDRGHHPTLNMPSRQRATALAAYQAANRELELAEMAVAAGMGRYL